MYGLVSCPWALSFCILIPFVFVFADVCVCNPRNVAKSNLDGGGWAWAEQIGQSAGEVDLSPHQGHGQHQAIAHPGFPSQGQLMLKGSLLFRRLKFQITTRDFSWYQLFLELYHATSLFCRLCKLQKV